MAESRTLEPEEWGFWDTWMRAQSLVTRELERGLQRDCGISKAEFSVLVTLWRAEEPEMRVCELAGSLGWDKGRVSHQLTRMENRGFVKRTRYGADGRRAGIGLTAEGRRAAEGAVLVHAGNIRRHVLNALTPEQAEAIRAWSAGTVDRIEPRDGESAGQGDEGAPDHATPGTAAR